MPYQESPHFDTPSHTATLCRYMHIDKFMSMFYNQSLYFTKITEFKDTYEGILSGKSLKAVYQTNLLNEKNTPIDQDRYFNKRKTSMDKFPEGKEKIDFLCLDNSFDTLLTRFSKHLMFCSCWFLNPTESHSMWASYGDNSPTAIMIQTTVGNLIDSFESSPLNIHIGKIKYIDYNNEHIEDYEYFTSKDLTNPYNLRELFYAPIMHKRNIYADEHEVRAVISFESICEKYLDRIYTSKIPFYSDRLFEKDTTLINFTKNNKMRKIPKGGIDIKVWLDLLIKNVVLSPYAKGYFEGPLKELMDNKGLNKDMVYVSKIKKELDKSLL